jgi:4-amino-4-deoxy-L-arabinose transferase-like glycosyltransferase
MALRFWHLSDPSLLNDEAYYWLWSRHLDWAYFDNPAGIALLVWLSRTLGGASEMGIRWINALLSVGCVLMTWWLGVQMLGRRAGLFAALVVAVGAPYLITGRFVYPDALQLFLLLLNLMCFWRLVEERPAPRLPTAVAFGLTLALLFNTKYNAYLYAAALLVATLIDHRHLFRSSSAWLGACLGLLGLLPVVLWNAAHDWASYRWQLAHAGFSLSGSYSLLGNAYYSLTYLTWPLAALALVGGLVGVGRIRRPAERLLILAALFLIAPVALSAANSPRNLSSGLVLLVLLAGTLWPKTTGEREARWRAAALALAVIATGLYGIGTLADLEGPSSLPGSSVVRDIRRDAAGWGDLGPRLGDIPEPIFALDYSIAAQIWYYSGRPAYTAWGQYRLWGIPSLREATIVGLDYLPAALVTERLQSTYQDVGGAQRLQFKERGVVKEVRLWQVRNLRVAQQTLLDELDFLNLLKATQ